MRSLRWVGLVPSLLIAGVLGGLLAPLPSEALNSIQPTVTIDGVNVIMTRIPNVNNACPLPDTAYNSCWSIPIGPYNGWTVGHYDATTNKARVLINDSVATGSRDNMKLTGITFTKTGGQLGVTYVTHAIITHLFNEGGGNISGDYQWSMAQGGQFDPPSTENVVGNKLKLVGTGSGSGITNFSVGTLDTGTFTTSTIPNKVGYVTKSNTASTVKPACNTGSGRCAPTIKYDYEITIVGLDQLQLSDSVSGNGGVCYKGLKLKLLKLIDHIFDHFDHLADNEHPLGCTKFAAGLNEQTQTSVDAIVATGIASGGVAAETCLGGCIVINKTVDPDLNVPGATMFDFTGAGAGMQNFTLTAGDCGEDPCEGDGTQTFSGLSTGGAGGSRTITETGFPYVSDAESDGGDGDHDKFWWTRSVSCESTLSGSVGNVGPSLWTTFAPTFATVNANRAALGNNDPLPTGETAALRQGYVTVTNLEALDTLTCTFENRLYNDDVGNNDPDGD
jgi:hypothetical protein